MTGDRARALVLEHQPDAPPALLVPWAAERNLDLDVVAVAGGELPDPRAYDLVVPLGSDGSAYDDSLPWLAGERALLREALAADIPVLGICFGAQLLARELGARVAASPQPEVGWSEIEPLDGAAVPAGPWLQWHGDAFDVPAGAQLLARSAVCPQAYRHGRHVGVQFHPEVTPDVVAAWVAAYPESLERARVSGDAILRDTARHAPAAREAAWRLFDAALEIAGVR